MVSEDISGELIDTARNTLARTAAEFGCAQADSHVAAGKAAREIAKAAEALDADMVVLGAHGEHWSKDLFTGSTAEAVADICERPVLMVRYRPAEPYRLMLVGMDLTGNAVAAAQFAMRVTPRSRIVIAHVAIVLGENLLRINGVSEQEVDQLRHTQVVELRPKVEMGAEQFGAELTATIVESGHVELRLAMIAADIGADLLVVGNRRRSKLERSLLGSVTRSSIQRSCCDVLIVRTT